MTVIRSRWPWSIRVNLARFVFSQSCSVFFWVVSLRLRIISLMLSFSAATSPWASTAIERVRSPLVTAVATSAMARTWVVRLAASWLTFSVRSFQVPAAPGHLGLAAELPLDAHLAGHGGDLLGEGGQRVGHLVDRVGQRGDLPLGLDDQLPLQVAVGDRRDDLGDPAHLAGEVAGHRS